MMQTTDFGKLHDPARFERLDRPDIRRILVEREMSTSPVIVREVRGQSASQMSLADNDDVVQTRAPDRADKALGERVLPGAVRRREDFVDPDALHSVPKLLAVDLVTVAQDMMARSRPGTRPRSAGRSRRRWDVR